MIRVAMADCGLSSIYRLYLLTDLSRPTVYRWLGGKTCIPLSGARKIVKALAGWSNRCGALRSELAALLASAQTVDSPEVTISTELRARGIPVRRTLDALRAANILPLKGSAAPKPS
jgi:hypothetical protein